MPSAGGSPLLAPTPEAQRPERQPDRIEGRRARRRPILAPKSPLGAVTFTLLLFAAVVALLLRMRRGRPALVRARLKELAEETGATQTTHGLRIVRSRRTFDAGLVWAKGHRHAAIEIWTGDSDGAPPPAGPEDYRSAPEQPPPPVVGRTAIAMHLETWRDRLGKLLRINREVQTGDDAFDHRVYLESDATDQDIRAVLADGRTRAGILHLLDLGFSLVRINGRDDATLAAVKLWPDADQLRAERNWKTTDSDGGIFYYLEFPPVRPGARSVDVSVSEAFYASHAVGAPVVMGTRAGAFGWEWREGIYATR